MDKHVEVLRALSQEPASTRRGRPYTQDEITTFFEVDDRAKRAALSGKYVCEICRLESRIFNRKRFKDGPQAFSRTISGCLKTDPDHPIRICDWFDELGRRVVGFYHRKGFKVLIDLAEPYCPRLHICWALDDAAELLKRELEATGNRADMVFLLNLTTDKDEAKEESVLDCLDDEDEKALVTTCPESGTSQPNRPILFVPTPGRTTMNGEQDGQHVRLSEKQARLAKLVYPRLSKHNETKLDNRVLAVDMDLDPNHGINDISTTLTALHDAGIIVRTRTGWFKRGPNTKVNVFKRTTSPKPIELFDLAELYPLAEQAPPPPEPEQVAPPADAAATPAAPPVSHFGDAPKAHANGSNGQSKTADVPSIERAKAIFVRLRELEARMSEIQVHRGQETSRIEEAQVRLGELDAGLEQVQTELNEAWVELATVATICATSVSA